MYSASTVEWFDELSASSVELSSELYATLFATLKLLSSEAVSFTGSSIDAFGAVSGHFGGKVRSSRRLCAKVHSGDVHACPARKAGHICVREKSGFCFSSFSL